MSDATTEYRSLWTWLREVEFRQRWVDVNGVSTRIAEAAAVDGIDGIFLGPADLAASLGHLGDQAHPEVTGAVTGAIKAITAAGKAAGVNAFPRDLAQRYLAAGARFILVGADVTLLAAGSEELAARHRPQGR